MNRYHLKFETIQVQPVELGSFNTGTRVEQLLGRGGEKQEILKIPHLLAQGEHSYKGAKWLE